eukprot:SAG31_NODE_1844_length_7106_cov_3.064935_10_plen_78_part_00
MKLKIGSQKRFLERLTKKQARLLLCISRCEPPNCMNARIFQGMFDDFICILRLTGMRKIASDTDSGQVSDAGASTDT